MVATQPEPVTPSETGEEVALINLQSFDKVEVSAAPSAPEEQQHDAAAEETRAEEEDRETEKEDEKVEEAADEFMALSVEEPEKEVVAEAAPSTEEAAPAPAPTGYQPQNPEFERDFDEGPTELYTLIQMKIWDETIDRVKQFPKEARIWTYRREKTDLSLRWRLLPIHAAIVFQAPDAVIEALLSAYPKAAQLQDDLGMLPLHLAFRNGSSEEVVRLLLVAYPKSVDVIDNKGRIPLVLAQASTSPNRDAFIKALDRGPSYFANAAAATERAAVTAEQRAIFDATLMQVKQSHQQEITQLRRETSEKEQMLSQKLAVVEQELAKSQEASQVLVDHVNSLEAQLSSRSDTERFLATKIATLDSNLKDTTKTREETEASLKAQVYQLTLERDSYKTRFEQLDAQHTTTQEKLRMSTENLEKREKEWLETEKHLIQRAKATDIDWANAKANCAILDAQLKKKVETEHALATQVSALAAKLAESAAESRDSAQNYARRIRNLEDERKQLRDSIYDLTKRLSLVAKLLDEMTLQQQSIVKQAKIHEEEMEVAAKAHEKIVADAAMHETMLENAKQERIKMMEMLERQDKEVENVTEEKAAIMKAIAAQSEHMTSTKESRESLLANVESLGAEIEGMMNSVLKDIPQDKGDADELVDSVLKLTAEDEEESKPEEVPMTPRSQQSFNEEEECKKVEETEAIKEEEEEEAITADTSEEEAEKAE